MSYRYGLSPSDIVQDARGNVLNTTLTLYVLEADADARTNPLTTVPVSSGNWSYTSNTYKSLWARTDTSDAFPVVSVDAQISSLDNTVSVTDNSDGGYTVGGFKLGGWQWAKDTFVAIANAVGLSTTTPVADTPAGSAGTAATAARGDHSHLDIPVFGPPLTLATAVNAFHSPLGPPSSQGGGAQTMANMKGNLSPLPIYRPTKIVDFALRVQTAGDASAQVAFAIYATDPVTGKLKSQAPVYTSTYQAATSTTWLTWTGINLTLPRGLYYICAGTKGFTATRPLLLAAWPYIAMQFLPTMGFTFPTNSDSVAGMTLSTFNETSGAFPSTIADADISYTNNAPSFFFYTFRADAP